ncbi:DUF1349 domain-containing protein [Streptomyces hoynatensis]|uniref:DUF1349 domain-containing protein n=2 Tax=Streptomyces hoynatensis TaxID=1141874 RepID=A0A3A9Z1W1_9ACTN|nr:DUF1349 domain-containing protein [Streptomyces hoynatensis]
MSWLNEPPSWSVEDGRLTATTGPETDFWRETFYGFVRDDGHFLYREVHGDFTAQVTLSGDYETLYDQSGLMVRGDRRTWLKTGVEFTDGLPHLSAVLTREHSDWSVVPLPELPGPEGTLTLRVTRHGAALLVQYLRPDGRWQLLRLGHLPLGEVSRVGVMCCSPERGGFTARFTGFSVGDPIERRLHE